MAQGAAPVNCEAGRTGPREGRGWPPLAAFTIRTHTRRMANKRRKPSRPASPRRNAPEVRATAPRPAAARVSSLPQGSPARIRRADMLHLGLLLGAVALSYLLPFELLLLSYAILGPAHYLTEISWLHDRKYFLPQRWLALLLCLFALGSMFMASDFWLGILLCFTFTACAILAGIGTGPRALAFLAIAAGSFALLGLTGIPFGLAWVLVPTVIHVSVFTLVFMTVGAFRSRSTAQFALVGFYLAAIAAILLVPPSRATVIPSLARLGGEYFGDIPLALGSLLRIPNLTFDTRITGLLSFVYTYHYLNWIIKADVIRWADVPRPRLVAIAGLSLAATGLYFYNYAYGFTVLLLLSFLHVLLEFPLNSISIRQLGAAIGGGLRPRKPAAVSG